MPNTPNLGLPYPSPSDPPNGAAQIQALAESLDDQVRSMRTRITVINVDDSTTGTAAITFGVPFPAGSVPVVVGTADLARWSVGADDVTRQGFLLRIREVSNTKRTEAVSVSWIAVQPKL
jgi:hypothetical protein